MFIKDRGELDELSNVHFLHITPNKPTNSYTLYGDSDPASKSQKAPGAQMCHAAPGAFRGGDKCSRSNKIA